ncbi:MAG: cytochrome P450 [Rhodobacteraceae bacterium]|nr:cytochrome P450 [Paracoccaceae bacterium]
MSKRPAKPASRPDGVGLIGRIKLFRQDIFASQPAKLYRAWMAVTRTPFFSSYLINQPDLVKRVLKERPDDFPKSPIIHDTLRQLLGNSVFVTNGEVWKQQRRIIDPAFEGGRLKDAFQAMRAAGLAALDRLGDGGEIEMEFETSHLTADVIFRTLFSIPIADETAANVFQAFRDYQRTQPLWNVPGLLQLPRWIPRFRSKKSAEAARKIRDLLQKLVLARQENIALGVAPDDLATKIMCAKDPVTGRGFDADEMIDQVAIFFLAGHETSASALSWALYLLAFDPEVQQRVAAEVEGIDMENIQFSQLSKMPFTRAVFRETLRLYPPVPMMVRKTAKKEAFRDRIAKKGSMVILSPWHLHRHERLWDKPDDFDPDRWQTENGKTCQREAYIPFSAGPRVCPGAGFAMAEGVLLLAMLTQKFRFEIVEEPVPVAYLTVRAKNGILLRLIPRQHV